MPLIHVDPFTTRVNQSIAPGATKIHIGLPDAACNTDFDEGEYFYVSISGRAGSERMRVTNCDGGVVTVVRTTGLSFECGDAVTISFGLADVIQYLKEQDCCGTTDEDTDGTTATAVECEKVASLPDTAVFYFGDSSKCNECFQITKANLMAAIKQELGI